MAERLFTERRLASDGVSTVGELLLDGQRLAFTLEPGPGPAAHPRKSPGRYALVLRREGGIYQKYRQRFGAWFDGIPQLLVPGRSFIEIHIGNKPEDTEGCSLLGASYEGPMHSASGHFEVCRSEEAFRRVYPLLHAAIQEGPTWWETVAEGPVA